MSGGAATVAFGLEDSFTGSVTGAPDYYEPGRNLTVDNLELRNVLQDIVVPDEPEPVESLAQDLEGAFGISGTFSQDVQTNLETAIFNDGGTAFAHGLAATSQWFLGVDHWSETAERQLLGVTPTEWSVTYERGNPPQWSGTFVYADERYNQSITPSTITEATEGSTVPSAGVEFTLDAETQAELQSLELTISDIAFLERGPDRVALNAIIGQPTTTLNATVLFRNSDNIDTAYGTSNATEPQTDPSSVTGSVSFDAAGGTATQYTFPRLDPESYTWGQLLTPNESFTEQLAFRVNGGVTTA
jgi:hypothetical protein